MCVQSIRSYFTGDDDFNWNYGLALAATGKYREAEEALAAVQRESYRFVFVGVVRANEQATRRSLAAGCTCFNTSELV